MIALPGAPNEKRAGRFLTPSGPRFLPRFIYLTNTDMVALVLVPPGPYAVSV